MGKLEDTDILFFFLYVVCSIQVKGHDNSDTYLVCGFFVFDIQQDGFNKQKAEAAGGKIIWFKDAIDAGQR